MFYSMFNNYSFHDTRINKICLLEDGIVFYLNQGLYSINAKKSENSKTPPCKVVISIDNFNKEKPFQHIEVVKQYKVIVKEINFDVLLNMMRKKAFDIYLDYYCMFSRSIKIEGAIDKSKIDITIFDIKSIDIVSI